MFEKELDNFIKNALLEDIGNGDHSSLGCITKDTISKAHLLIKDNGIIAGIELAKKLIKQSIINSINEISIGINVSPKSSDINQTPVIIYICNRGNYT